MINPAGNLFFKDDYGVTYLVEWETVRDLLDITTTTKQPYVWGEEDQAYVKNRVLFKRGVITVERQILKTLENGYAIIAEGASQICDFIQMNFPCETGPSDNFTYHLNCAIEDDVLFKVSDGPHWADVEVLSDIDAVWGIVDSDGSPGDLTSTGGVIPLEWIDVWT